jgi:hypothetical protein
MSLSPPQKKKVEELPETQGPAADVNADEFPETQGLAADVNVDESPETQGPAADVNADADELPETQGLVRFELIHRGRRPAEVVSRECGWGLTEGAIRLASGIARSKFGRGASRQILDQMYSAWSKSRKRIRVHKLPPHIYIYWRVDHPHSDGDDDDDIDWDTLPLSLFGGCPSEKTRVKKLYGGAFGEYLFKPFPCEVLAQMLLKEDEALISGKSRSRKDTEALSRSVAKRRHRDALARAVVSLLGTDFLRSGESILNLLDQRCRRGFTLEQARVVAETERNPTAETVVDALIRGSWGMPPPWGLCGGGRSTYKEREEVYKKRLGLINELLSTAKKMGF